MGACLSIVRMMCDCAVLRGRSEQNSLGKCYFIRTGTKRYVPVCFHPTLSGIDGDCIVNTGQIETTLTCHDYVALSTYRPEFDERASFRWLGWALGLSFHMILYFPVDRFDEVVEQDQWVVGRRLDSYVRGRLARRHQEKYVRWRQPRVTSTGALTAICSCRIRLGPP